MRPMYRHVESPPNIWSWICSPGLWDCRFGYQCLYCPKGIHRLVELGDVWFTLLLPVRYGHVSSIWLYVSAEEPFPICIESKHFRFIPYYELLNTVTQGSLKYDPGTKSISVTWKCDWNATSGLHSRPDKSKVLGGRPSWGFNKPPTPVWFCSKVKFENHASSHWVLATIPSSVLIPFLWSRKWRLQRECKAL